MLPDYVPFEKRTKQLQNLKQWHEMMVDFMLLNPAATQQEIADHFEFNVQTVKHVVCSDVFKMRLEERRAKFQERVDGTAIDRLSGKIAGVAERALDVMDEKIQAERLTLGIDAVRESTETLLRSLGYGIKQQGAAHQTVVNVLVSKDELARARAKAIDVGAQEQQAALPPPNSETK